MNNIYVTVLLVAAIAAMCASAAPALEVDNELSNDKNLAQTLEGPMPAAIRIPIWREFSYRNSALTEPQISHYSIVSLGTASPGYPSQWFKVTFDTGSGLRWIPVLSNNSGTNLHYKYGFDYEKSLTAKYQNKKEWVNFRGDTSLQCSMYNDVLGLAGRTWTRDHGDKFLPRAKETNKTSITQDFCVVKDSTNSSRYKYRAENGYFGLAPHSPVGSKHLLNELQDQQRAVLAQLVKEDPSKAELYNEYNENKYIAKLVFSFWFQQPNQTLTEWPGEISLGRVDPDRYAGRISFHNLENPDEWSLRLVQASLGRKVVSCQNGCRAHLDTGVNSLIGPRADVDNIHRLMGFEYDAASDMNLIDCSRVKQLPSLSFTFDETSYVIGPSYYVRVHQQTRVCYSGIKPFDGRDWVLGLNFISAFYTVFDLEKSRIGFAF